MRRVATVRQGDGRVAVRPGALPLPFGQSWSCWSGLQTYLVPATNSFSGRTLRFGTGTPLEGREEGPPNRRIVVGYDVPGAGRDIRRGGALAIRSRRACR